jgi:hypothetical protein
MTVVSLEAPGTVPAAPTALATFFVIATMKSASMPEMRVSTAGSMQRLV